jgi:hypothetical protein
MSNNYLIRKHSLDCERCAAFRHHLSARAAAAESWRRWTSYHYGHRVSPHEGLRQAFHARTHLAGRARIEDAHAAVLAVILGIKPGGARGASLPGGPHWKTESCSHWPARLRHNADPQQPAIGAASPSGVHGGLRRVERRDRL